MSKKVMYSIYGPYNEKGIKAQKGVAFFASYSTYGKSIKDCMESLKYVAPYLEWWEITKKTTISEVVKCSPGLRVKPGEKKNK